MLCMPLAVAYCYRLLSLPTACCYCQLLQPEELLGQVSAEPSDKEGLAVVLGGVEPMQFVGSSWQLLAASGQLVGS